MPDPKRTPDAEKSAVSKTATPPERDPLAIARKALARMGPRLGPGPKVRLPLTLDLAREDAERLLAEAITAERRLDGFVTALVEAHLRRPRAR